MIRPRMPRGVAALTAYRHCCWNCRSRALEVPRCAANDARGVGGQEHDELILLNMAAAMVDGVYQDIAGH